LDEIVDVDVDVVVHFEEQINFGAVLPYPIEDGDAFQRQISV
jgi:hypothetical protein